MGGGGATPTTPPGYTGGSAMDYNAPATSASPVQSATGGFDWPTFLASVGKAGSNFELGGQRAPTISTNINYPQSSLQIPIDSGGGGSGLIPATGQSDTAAVMEMLKRLLSGNTGGY